MLGSTILEVGIGIVLGFLLLSFIATAAREAIESWMKSRATYLERGIRELLADPNGSGMAKSFYEHPLIYSLYRGTFKLNRNRVRGRELPTYIPARNFAEAVLDLAIRGPVRDYSAAQAATELNVGTLRANIARLQNPDLIRAVLTATDHAGGDVSKVRENLQAWYDSSMDRVSGWYKRATQFWLFGIGFVLAVALNVNAFRIADGLWRDKPMREAIATRAEAMARDTSYQRRLLDTTYRKEDLKEAINSLTALSLPIGWSDATRAEAKTRSARSAGSFVSFWAVALLGYVLTALAVTLGAPFWFDVLNKFMVIRSTVKPHEKSPEEGSEDRQKDGKASAPLATSTAPQTTPTSNRQPAPSAAAATVGAAGATSAMEAEYVPHQWATAEPDAGVI